MVESVFIPITQDQIPASSSKTINQQPNIQLLTNGMASYPADYLRDPSTAKLLVNLLQSRREGIWTNRDCGITNYTGDTTAYNSGAQFLDFGFYIDANNNEQLLLQVGSVMYKYVFATPGGTSIKTGLSAAAPPCIRAFQPFQGGATSLSVVTNSASQPAYIDNTGTYNANPLNPPQYATQVSTSGVTETLTLGTNNNGNITVTVGGTITAGDALEIITFYPGIASTGSIYLQSLSPNVTSYAFTTTGSETFNYGSNISGNQTATIGGTVAAGNAITLTVTDSGLTGGSLAIIYKCIAGDTVASIANAIINLVNQSTPLQGLGISAAVAPQQAIGYTVLNTDTTTTIATALKNAINSTAALSSVGITATSAAAVITISFAAPTTQWGNVIAPIVATTKIYSKPAFCEAFNGSMVYGGFSDTTYPGTYQDILITNSGTYNQVTQSGTLLDTDGVIFNVPAICGKVTALKVVQLNNQNNSQAIIVGCQRGVCLIQGTGATTYSLVILTLQYGIPSNRALIQCQNDMIFLANDGIRCFSALIVNANLLTSSLSYGLQDYVQTWDQSNLQNAFVCGNRNTKDIQFWIPQLNSNGTTNSGICNLGFVFNYGSSSFGVSTIPQLNFTPSILQGLTPAAAIEFQDPNNNYQWTMFSGGYDGTFNVHYSPDVNTNKGVALPYFATFPLASATANNAAGFSQRKISIITEGGSQNFYANSGWLEMKTDGTMIKNGDPAGPRNLTTEVTLTTKLGTWVLGDSSLPANYTQLLEYEPVGEGRFLELQLSGPSSNNVIDLLGAHYLLSSGGLRR